MENPKIRFKGFTKDWEQRKLGDDLVSIHTGTNLLGSITNTGMPLIKMGNIQRGYFDTSKVEFLAENEQPDKADIVNYGDFFFNTRNTLELVGKGATWMKNSGEYAFNSNIARFELRNLDTIFFNYLYNTDYMTKQIHARAMGTTSVAAIYPRTLDSVEYLAPCMKEQQKIGAYFKQLDHLITLHQRKCEQTKNLKKYMLQKMFPQNGAKVPEIRFNGFTHDWEQRKFGSLLEETRNKTIFEDEDTLLSCAIDGMYLNSELFSHFRGSSNIGYLKVKKNDLILSAQNLHLGNCNVNLRFEHGIISPAYKVYELVGCNPLFMQAWVKKDSTKDFFLKSSTEGASVCRKNIVWEELYKQELPVPSIEEQTKVGEYFYSLDHLITLHQRKCDELKKMKKFMLQNMFI
jgi:type I restriction enzyme S subunit